ncbi:Response regulator [Pseudomonas sessilinigenes]|nr:Response regulator [Pseudomonas sessilinigenes]
MAAGVCRHGGPANFDSLKQQLTEQRFSMSEDAQDVVLIVEDEPVILMLLADYLSGLGYRVLQAENGEQAFEILASKPNLDLMITDYRLPGGITGVMIAEPAVKLRPDLKVIFISGYPNEILECNSPITRKAPILAKPFDLNSLHQQIQQLLA